ncbi:MAG: type II toxin-antitoxin system VapC family toxin [Pirellulales bacterium]
MTPATLLDSDVLSALMKRDVAVVQRARTYLTEHAQLSFSSITRYEVLRGLKAKQAVAQLRRFDAFCDTCQILPTSGVVDRAAEIYADLYRSGRLIGDADILIAATALDVGMELASNNAAHFGRVAGLSVVSWSS